MIFQSIQHLTIRLLKIFGKPLFNLLNNKKNITFRSRKTLPCTKGIKTELEFPLFTPYQSKDTALYERD